jgi:vitamin B12 transporter
MVFFLPLSLAAQMSIMDDTIKIHEVVISRKILNEVTAGYKQTKVDSSVLAEYSNGNLSEMLSGKAMIFIKSYGMGGLASPSFRGTGASQTVIDWNGININSPTLGQSDLSLIPVGLIDEIHIYYGGASMLLNNGGIGGAINLETRPVWKKETLMSLNAGTGSFGEHSGLVNVRTGNTNFQSVTKAYLMSAENNFRYLDNETSNQAVWKTRTNSQISKQGFIQELYFKNTDNEMSARLWYQASEKHIPPPINSTDYHEKEFDESLRLMFNDILSREKSRYSFTGAFLMDKLYYTSHQGKDTIDSRSLSQTLVLKGVRESHPWNYTNLKLSFNDELTMVKSNNFDKVLNRNLSTLTASFERECIDRIGITILVSEIVLNHSILIPDFSTGLQYRLKNGKEYFLKASISRNSGIPTMNDLYYPGAGNPDLKNEYSFSYELTWEMNHKISSSFNIKSDVSVYHNSIRDLIVWNPTAISSFWAPSNINRVISKGIESTLSIDYSVYKFNARISAAYSLTRSVTTVSNSPNDNSAGKQLRYVPVNQANSAVRLGYGIIYSSLETSFTGQRYTSKDASNDFLYQLPYNIINNAITGIKLPLHKASIDLSLNINNLFGFNYQSIANYPMPGRSYFMKILIQFLK